MLTNTLLLYVTQEALEKARERLAAFTSPERENEPTVRLPQLPQKMRWTMKTAKHWPTRH